MAQIANDKPHRARHHWRATQLNTTIVVPSTTGNVEPDQTNVYYAHEVGRLAGVLSNIGYVPSAKRAKANANTEGVRKFGYISFQTKINPKARCAGLYVGIRVKNVNTILKVS